MVNKKELISFLSGDVLSFILSLWLALAIRNTSIPTGDVLVANLLPFLVVFVIWILAFFVAGLYDKQRIAQRRQLPILLFQTQLFNSVVAIILFYIIPALGITPKTILFLTLLLSLGFSFVWRVYLISIVGKKRKEKAIVIAQGAEVDELVHELNHNTHSGLEVVSVVGVQGLSPENFEQMILRTIKENKVSLLIIDFADDQIARVVAGLYRLLFDNVRFADFCRLYEEVFDKLPVDMLRYQWFIENISLAPKPGYDLLKRIMDVILALVPGVLSLVVYPFVYIAIKLDDNGPIFIAQERVGKNGKKIKLHKFRSMSRNETDLESKKENKITRVGGFLRKTRIDELPQLWSVFVGDQSIIGPRPELPSGVAVYDKQIPYYNIRHLIKPGLSGWAQINQENHPHHNTAIQETKEKLSYDLYYIKNRSFALDVVIALKTLKTLLSRKGK